MVKSLEALTREHANCDLIVCTILNILEVLFKFLLLLLLLLKCNIMFKMYFSVRPIFLQTSNGNFSVGRGQKVDVCVKIYSVPQIESGDYIIWSGPGSNSLRNGKSRISGFRYQHPFLLYRY